MTRRRAVKVRRQPAGPAQPAPRSRLARVAPWVAVGVAGAMLAFRFTDLGLAMFVNDEPSLQIAAENQRRTGVWATHGLRGNQGANYGPLPIWFYSAVHTVAGPAPAPSIAAEGLLLTKAPRPSHHMGAGERKIALGRDRGFVPHAAAHGLNARPAVDGALPERRAKLLQAHVDARSSTQVRHELPKRRFGPSTDFAPSVPVWDEEVATLPV